MLGSVIVYPYNLKQQIGRFMKQQLGLKYSLNQPVSAIISSRLVELQQIYGGVSVLGAITRIQRKGYKSSIFIKKSQYWTDVHINNLCEAYGRSKVIEVYNMIYSLNNEKQSVNL